MEPEILRTLITSVLSSAVPPSTGTEHPTLPPSITIHINIYSEKPPPKRKNMKLRALLVAGLYLCSGFGVGHAETVIEAVTREAQGFWIPCPAEPASERTECRHYQDEFVWLYGLARYGNQKVIMSLANELSANTALHPEWIRVDKREECAWRIVWLKSTGQQTDNSPNAPTVADTCTPLGEKTIAYAMTRSEEIIKGFRFSLSSLPKEPRYRQDDPVNCANVPKTATTSDGTTFNIVPTERCRTASAKRP